MTSDAIYKLANSIQDLIIQRKWYEATEVAEELLGALKVKSCMGE